ncbi:hypothetical protein GJAV_G00225420 [Gymnothorax javanicus]|nr:hypothetical protein GJAV_G00225420 [Gymnothorax javanicus]
MLIENTSRWQGNAHALGKIQAIHREAEFPVLWCSLPSVDFSSNDLPCPDFHAIGVSNKKNIKTSPLLNAME